MLIKLTCLFSILINCNIKLCFNFSYLFFIKFLSFFYLFLHTFQNKVHFCNLLILFFSSWDWAIFNFRINNLFAFRKWGQTHSILCTVLSKQSFILLPKINISFNIWIIFNICYWLLCFNKSSAWVRNPFCPFFNTLSTHFK